MNHVTRNYVHLEGYASEDAVCRSTGTGQTVCNVTLETHEKRKDRIATVWHRVVFWGDLGKAAKNIKKGDFFGVEGKMTYGKYTDKTGRDVKTADIVGSNLEVKEKTKESPVVQFDQNPPAETFDDIPF